MGLKGAVAPTEAKEHMVHVLPLLLLVSFDQSLRWKRNSFQQSVGGTNTTNKQILDFNHCRDVTILVLMDLQGFNLVDYRVLCPAGIQAQQ